MEAVDLQALSNEEIGELLKQKDISYRKLAESLSMSHSTISEIINGKYTGSKATIKKVWDHIYFVLRNKEDLNPLVYNNTDTFIKLLNVAIKHKSFNDDETMKFIELKKVLTNYSNSL